MGSSAVIGIGSRDRYGADAEEENEEKLENVIEKIRRAKTGKNEENKGKKSENEGKKSSKDDDDKLVACTKDLRPVCCEGVEYGNQCLADADGANDCKDEECAKEADDDDDDKKEDGYSAATDDRLMELEEELKGCGEIEGTIRRESG